MATVKRETALGGPGADLHAAIDRGDWPAANEILNLHGASAGTVKNRGGSTPLMLAAGGKPGRKTYRLLVDALLAVGCGSTAAERSHKGKTAADYAAARGDKELAEKLRALIPTAAAAETRCRCKICGAKLRKGQSTLQYVGDKVQRGDESNPF